MEPLKIGSLYVPRTPHKCGTYLSKQADCVKIIENGRYEILRCGVVVGECWGCFPSVDLQEIKKKEDNKQNKNMSLKEKYKLAFKSEPEKTFNRAQVTDSSDTLTTEGTAVFLQWLLKKHGEEFKKDVVDPILEAERVAKKSVKA